MPYNRKMPDWSIKVYYSSEETKNYVKTKILESAEKLREEIISKDSIRIKKVNNKEIVYV